MNLAIPHSGMPRNIKARKDQNSKFRNGRIKMAKIAKSTDSSSLAEVVDRILDKGIVIDAWVKVSLVGIELLSVEARVVIASVETYLKYAEAIGLTATAAAPA
jgi:gas vesicle structural protein